MVASDRISAFDYVLESTIPGKGEVLTRMSLWWFDRLAGLAPHHVLSTGVPDAVRGRAVVCEALEMYPVECVARGYLAGSGLVDYRASGQVCGVPLPSGLDDGSRLPEPIFTPATKAALGEHDENVSYDAVVDTVGQSAAAELRRLTLAVYTEAEAIARDRGILLADTKLEFGRAGDATLVLADEALTPDSSRFWPAAEWHRAARSRPTTSRSSATGCCPSPAGTARRRPAAAVARARGRADPGALRRGLRAAHRDPLLVPVTVTVDFPTDRRAGVPLPRDPRNRPDWQSSLRRVDDVHGAGELGTTWVDVTAVGARPRMEVTDCRRSGPGRRSAPGAGSRQLGLRFVETGPAQTRVTASIDVTASGAMAPVAAAVRLLRRAGACGRSTCRRERGWLRPAQPAFAAKHNLVLRRGWCVSWAHPRRVRMCRVRGRFGGTGHVACACLGGGGRIGGGVSGCVWGCCRRWWGRPGPAGGGRPTWLIGSTVISPTRPGVRRGPPYP